MSDIYLWCYMSLDKFIVLIQLKKLFFCRADLFDDKLEGKFFQNMIIQEITRKNNKIKFNNEYMKLPNSDKCGLYTTASLSSFISCWHINKHESIAMWKLYGGHENKNLCLQTNIQKINNIIKNHKEHVIKSKKVKYINYSQITKGMYLKQTTDMFFYKRESFEYEKEYRLVLHDNANLIFDKQEKIHPLY